MFYFDIWFNSVAISIKELTHNLDKKNNTFYSGNYNVPFNYDFDAHAIRW